MTNIDSAPKRHDRTLTASRLIFMGAVCVYLFADIWAGHAASTSAATLQQRVLKLEFLIAHHIDPERVEEIVRELDSSQEDG